MAALKCQRHLNHEGAPVSTAEPQPATTATSSEPLRDLPTADLLRRLHASIAQVIRGKNEVITEFLTAIVAGGSILLEDLPGVGKTTLAKTFASLVDLKFQRLQCTPDLLPADVFGFSVYNSNDSSFTFRPGPIFSNVLLVDEINRASPRTQSALLEAMAERQVTIEGNCRQLGEPFLVIATQNPSGFQGTYPLPEAQLDRFLFLLTMDYPDHDSEIELLYDQDSDKELQPIITAEELVAAQRRAASVQVHRDLADYLVRIVKATREDSRLELGCSPRGAQMLFRSAQAAALLAGREIVLPDDIQRVAPLCLAHRLVKKRKTTERHQGKRSIVQELIANVPVPG